MQTRNVAQEQIDFVKKLEESVQSKNLIKLTLSKSSNNQLLQIFGVLIEIKGEFKLKLTLRFETKDETKIVSVSEIEQWVNELLPNTFKNAHLITSSEEISLLFSKKYKPSLVVRKKQQLKEIKSTHDREKLRYIPLYAEFLKHLGVADQQGKLIPKMSDKYKQINRYIEIIDDHLKYVSLPSKPIFVDMGSGKAYLTFALAHYLETKNIEASIIGVELREDLVSKCNAIAQWCHFEKLTFLSKRIEDFKSNEIDVLIALHACDTATDDAIAAGIKSACELIICAPCCHKQVRQSINTAEINNPILKHGIFTERSCEMLTDTIRAMILESKGYKTKVFEFISNEHTRKNIMLTATKTANMKDIKEDLSLLKTQYGLKNHYLESLI